jgi:uncharacterized delta-60 repeat protein
MGSCTGDPRADAGHIGQHLHQGRWGGWVYSSGNSSARCKNPGGGEFHRHSRLPQPDGGKTQRDGTIDPGFTSPFPTPVLASRLYTTGIQTNGQILVGGLFTAIGGTFRTNIARIQPNGDVDSSFNALGGPSGLVRVLAIQPDGKVLIGGEFTLVNNIARSRIARLNTDGTLDTSFDPASGANDIIRAVALLPSGQILVGGLFTSFAGTPKPYLARLNSDGSLDASFPTGSGPDNNVYFILVEQSGSLIISGDFTAMNGAAANRVARLGSDGTLDPGFQPPSSVLGGPVYHVLTQANGRLVLGGGFTSINGVGLNRLARLNGNGTLDSSFNSGSGANDMILSLALQSDGMILAAGLFSTYQGTTVNMLARVVGDPLNPLLTIQTSGANQIQLTWPASASGFSLQSGDAPGATGWQTVATAPTLDGDRLVLTAPVTTAAKFYRLAR